MTTVQVARVDATSPYRVADLPAHRTDAAGDWFVCWSPLVAGAFTAFRSKDEAVEHSHGMWLRYGATVPVTLYQELPS